MNIVKGQAAEGNVYVMTHSIFSNIVRIGCTSRPPEEYAKVLSKNIPGDYDVVFQLFCKNPCQIKQQVKEYLSEKKYVNEFYEVAPERVAKLIKNESLKISNFHA